MATQLNFNLSGRIDHHEVADTAAKITAAPDCGAVELRLSDVVALDLSCVQLIVELRERFGTAFQLHINSIAPELKTLLTNTGMYELINDSSN